MLIDSHAHLEMKAFDKDLPEVVDRARQAGVDAIVTVGTNLGEARKAVRLAQRFDMVFAAIGIHPHDVKDIDAKTYETLKALAREKKVVAYGEIGLDFFRNHSPRQTQIQRFAEQLDLAGEIGLPVIIHDREAHKETLDMLQAWTGNTGGVIHCFSGDVAMATRCLDMGFYISIPGPVTYPKSDGMVSVARHVPADRLLVETDCPYLSPQPHRGKRNEPAFVRLTTQKIAELRGLPWEEVARTTAQNARRLFGIP